MSRGPRVPIGKIFPPKCSPELPKLEIKPYIIFKVKTDLIKLVRPLFEKAM